MASVMFAIFLTTAVIHFAGWMQLHSSAVTWIMCSSLALAAGCWLFWIFTLRQLPDAAVDNMLEPPRDSQVNTNTSTGNVHFAPVIQIGTSGSPPVSSSTRSGIESSYIDASEANASSSSSRASETSANMGQDCPISICPLLGDLPISRAQCSAFQRRGTDVLRFAFATNQRQK